MRRVAGNGWPPPRIRPDRHLGRQPQLTDAPLHTAVNRSRRNAEDKAQGGWGAKLPHLTGSDASVVRLPVV
jgi:hypothetical protein